MSTFEKSLEVFLRERLPKDIPELTQLAKQYIEAHRSSDGVTTIKDAMASDLKVTAQDHRQTNGERRCFTCNRSNHLARDCYYREAHRPWYNSILENGLQGYNARGMSLVYNQKEYELHAAAPGSSQGGGTWKSTRE